VVGFTLRPLYIQGNIPKSIGYEAGVGPRDGLDDVDRIIILLFRDSNSDTAVQPVASRYTDCSIPAIPN
jgi:hypothetical protein